MNKQEHLLTIIMEECNEVAQRASKALRFGLDEIQEGQHLTNAERVMVEYDDLRGAISLAQQWSMLPASIRQRIEDKKTKIFKYLEYSKSVGMLQ